jgi:hypothetical protein
MSELRHRFHPGNDGTFVISAHQDVEPILEANKAMKNNGKQKGDFRLVASIPNIFIEKWIREEGVNYMNLDKQEFARLIAKKRRDPDYRDLFAL